MRRQKKLT